MSERLTKNERLRKREDIRNVLRRRGRSGKYLILHVRKNAEKVSRLGIVIRRTVGTAVFRNRTKRRIREVFRRSQDQIKPRADIVVRVKKEIRNATFWDIAEDFIDLLYQQRVIPRRYHSREVLKENTADRRKPGLSE